ncbi:pickpocket protein 28-like [Pieris napi]|uniref:pickpocket protein 28-like n=1 Tax=Pieris napi TaxID=78633 RepID=UPI001FBAFD61|nr:pickpocket protein 28-like [Pieris napi]
MATEKRNSFDSVKEYFTDYTTNSNLHGLKYIGEKQRTLLEKLFWVLMFTSCVLVCGYTIMKQCNKWPENPIIVSFAERPTPVWQIPYPAMTICSQTKVKQTKFNLTEYRRLFLNNYTFANFTEEERNTFEDVSMICNLLLPYGRETSTAKETIDNLRRLSPDMNEIFPGCMWKDAISNCSDMFYEVITEEGFCYTFNSLGANELLRLENLHKDYNYMALDHKNISWTLDGGYPPNSPLDSYPWRGSPYGTNAYLTFSLMANVIDFDYACRGPIQGFKILLHNPAELPRVSEQHFIALVSKQVIVAVKPKMMTTSEGLGSYDPERRQCYLQNERYLNYFKIYTQSNCEMECLTNFTNARCGCVHFGMPHGQNMSTCSVGKIACIKKSKMELATIEMKSAMAADDENDTIIGEAREVALRCKCLPACTSIDYEAEISQADYDWKSLLRALALSRVYEKKDMLLGQVVVFFKEAQFIASRRSELFGPYDFLANCGGLLGLFMGFSILSVVEIIYFLTLR